MLKLFETEEDIIKENNLDASSSVYSPLPPPSFVVKFSFFNFLTKLDSKEQN